MLDLTVVNVESLLNTVHICSSQHATGNCSIYKPKEKNKQTKKQQQWNYYNCLDSRRLEHEERSEGVLCAREHILLFYS